MLKYLYLRKTTHSEEEHDNENYRQFKLINLIKFREKIFLKYDFTSRKRKIHLSLKI